MPWILFSILAPAVWAFTNIVDKYVFSKWVRDPLVFAATYGLVGFLVGFIVYPPSSWHHITTGLLILALVSGVVYFFANLFYFKGAQVEEISRVISLIYLDPLFTAVLGAIFLGEIFSPIKYLAICMLVAGAVIISYKSGQGMRFSKGVWFCVLAAFLYAINNILAKHVLGGMDWHALFFYARTGTLIALLPIMYKKRAALRDLIVTQPFGFTVMTLNDLLGMVGIIFFTIALSLGYATLTTSLSALQPFFVLVIASLVSFFAPLALEEEKGIAVFIKKLLAIALMFVGAILITSF